MEIGYKYRIYPNVSQRELLSKTFGSCRFVYNRCLDRRKSLYENEGRSVGRTDCNNWCNRELKEEFEWLREVDKFALTNAIYDMDFAYRKFFREHAGYPKFRSKHDGRQSYKTNLTGNNIRVDFERNVVRLPKLGEVKAKLHRRFDGTIKNATVSLTPSGKYFVSFCVDIPQPEFIPATGMVGIDLGIKNLAVCSDGKKHDIPDRLSPLERRLRREQHALARKVKGSSNRNKQKKKIARLHERAANIRKDNMHKLTHAIVTENQIIVSESLNVKGMLRNHHLARSIAESSWSELTRQLSYKSSMYGRKYIKIDPFFPSSQTCSNCGFRNKRIKDLSVRQWDCPQCGVRHDRDINAARNILVEVLRQEGLEQYLGQGLPEIKPVDRPTVDDRCLGDLRSRAGMKQEAHRLYTVGSSQRRLPGEKNIYGRRKRENSVLPHIHRRHEPHVKTRLDAGKHVCNPRNARQQ